MLADTLVGAGKPTHLVHPSPSSFNVTLSHWKLPHSLIV